MIDLLAEGVRSIALPCTLALVVPGLVGVFAAGSRALWVLACYVPVAGIAAWARFAGFGPAELTGVAVLGAACLVAAATVLAWQLRPGHPAAAAASRNGAPRPASRVAVDGSAGARAGADDDESPRSAASAAPAGRAAAAAAASGGLLGLVAAWSWQPCVGVHLGDVLSSIGQSPMTNLTSMVVFVAGTCAVLAVVALAPVAVPVLAPVRDSIVTRSVGLGMGSILALLLAVGWYDDLVDELLRASSWGALSIPIRPRRGRRHTVIARGCLDERSSSL